MISRAITRVPSLCPQRKAKRIQPACAHRDRSPSPWPRRSPRDGFTRGDGFSIKPRRMPSSGKPGRDGKAAKISEIIFSGLLPFRRAGENGARAARLTWRTSAHFFTLAELELPRCWNSRHFAVLDGGKSRDMGVGARRARAEQDLSTEIGVDPDRQARAAARAPSENGGRVDTPDPRCYQLRPLRAHAAPEERPEILRRTS